MTLTSLSEHQQHPASVSAQAALSAWLVAGGTELPRWMCATVDALVERFALLAAGHADPSALVHLRGLVARAVSVAGQNGLGVSDVDPALDLQLARRFARDASLDGARSLNHEFWPEGVADAWWFTLAAPAQDPDEGELDAAWRVLEAWLHARRRPDGRIRLSATEARRVLEAPDGPELLDLPLVEVELEEVTGTEWRFAAARPGAARRPTHQRRFPRLSMPFRLAAADVGPGAVWLPGRDALFRFVTLRTWLEPGLGLVAHGQWWSHGDHLPACMVLPAGVQRLAVADQEHFVGEPGALILPVRQGDTSLQVTVLGQGGLRYRRAVLDVDELVGRGECVVDETDVEVALREVMRDIRAGDLLSARTRLDELRPELLPAELAAVDALETLLETP